MIRKVKLSDSKKVILDKALINSESKLGEKSRALEKILPTEDLYPKIRKLVVKEKNMIALYALAKYKKKENIEIMTDIINEYEKSEEMNGIKYLYLAIKEMPFLEFFPFLEEKFKMELSNDRGTKVIYEAMVAYKNEESLKLLRTVFTEIKDEMSQDSHMKCLYDALSENKDEIYEPLCRELWEKRVKSVLKIIECFIPKIKSKKDITRMGEVVIFRVRKEENFFTKKILEKMFLKKCRMSFLKMIMNMV